MKIQCCWCRKDMGEKDGKGIEGISHSICIKCWVEKWHLKLEDYNAGRTQKKQKDNQIKN